MKKYLIYLFTLASTLLIGCDSFRDMSGTAEVNPITVDVYLDITVENISTLKDLTVKLDNYDEDLHYVKEVTDNSVKVDGIIPGIYSVTVSGTAIDTENNEYYINGNSVNAALFKHGSALNIEVQGLKVSPLIFKEIYYCGSRPEKGGVYFRDQFYEIYNNSADILYLDGIYFANLTPGTATTKLPIIKVLENTILMLYLVVSLPVMYKKVFMQVEKDFIWKIVILPVLVLLPVMKLM